MSFWRYSTLGFPILPYDRGTFGREAAFPASFGRLAFPAFVVVFLLARAFPDFRFGLVCLQILSMTPLENRPWRSSTSESIAPAQSVQIDFQRAFVTGVTLTVTL